MSSTAHRINLVFKNTVAATNAGNKVHTVGIVDTLSDDVNINQLELSFMRPTPFKVVHCCVSSSFCRAPSCKIM